MSLLASTIPNEVNICRHYWKTKDPDKEKRVVTLLLCYASGKRNPLQTEQEEVNNSLAFLKATGDVDFKKMNANKVFVHFLCRDSAKKTGVTLKSAGKTKAALYER